MPTRQPAQRPGADSPRDGRGRSPVQDVPECLPLHLLNVVRELSAAAILFTSETKVLSVLIFDLNESGDLAAIAVLGLTMLILTSAVIAAASRVPGLGGPLRVRHY